MAAVVETPRIVELAAKISESVRRLQAVLDAKGIPTPSFGEDAALHLPKEIADDQNTVLDSASELYDLLLEPTTLVLKNSATNAAASLAFIARHNIPGMVPLKGHVTFAEIAKKTGFTESIVTRLMRDAVCMRVFQEPEPRVVTHSRVSKALREPWFLSFVRGGSEEGNATMSKMMEALEKWPNCEEPDQTAFNLMHNTSGTYFDNVANDPAIAERFAGGMSIQWEFPGFQLDYTYDSYDWASLGQVQIVDLAGFRGRISIALADRFPNLDMLVQDMSMNEDEAHAAVPAHLKDRVNFMAHDVFQTQPVSADIYYIRQVLHDWPDKYSIKILRQQIPSLRKGARIFLHESLLPETPGSGPLPLWQEKDLRFMDLGLIAVMNGRERTLKEWKEIFAEADSRFVFQRVVQPKGSVLALMEFGWDV